MANGPVTRFEFDALTRRVETLDQRGTGPAGAALARLEAIERELAALQRERAEEKRERSVTRRWIIGVAFTAIAASVAIASFVATFILHVR